MENRMARPDIVKNAYVPTVQVVEGAGGMRAVGVCLGWPRFSTNNSTENSKTKNLIQKKNSISAVRMMSCE